MNFDKIQFFEGYYVQIIEIDNNKLRSGEYLIQKDSLLSVLKYPSKIVNDAKGIRFFNHDKFYFSRIPYQELPEGASNLDQLELNYKVSLHRREFNDCDELFQSISNKNYFFYIKRVSIDIEPIGSVKDFRDKRYDLDFIGIHGRYFNNRSEENFLLRKIYSRKLFDFWEGEYNLYVEYVKVKKKNTRLLFDCDID